MLSIGCAPKTLRKRCRDDLDRGVAEADLGDVVLADTDPSQVAHFFAGRLIDDKRFSSHRLSLIDLGPDWRRARRMINPTLDGSRSARVFFLGVRLHAVGLLVPRAPSSIMSQVPHRLAGEELSVPGYGELSCRVTLLGCSEE